MREGIFRGLRNRVFQEIARVIPGAQSTRVQLHRWRGVKIGSNTWIGYDCVLETSSPELISIGSNVVLNMRVLMVAHFRETEGITIEDDVFVGPGAIILPNVTIGRGSVISAGSVVATSIPPMILATGNPARPVAKCGVVLSSTPSIRAFYRALRPLKK